MRTRFLFTAFVFACVSLEAATIQMPGGLVNESNNLTPEPATFLMLGGGLLAVAALLRRMRKL